MPTTAERLARRKARPLLVELHRALGRLTSTLTVMNTGAHPDDEQSGLLALLRYGMGIRVVIACSTRGEGGQNSLGPERGAALGVLRTRELEEAARVLDADIAWLGFGPGDPVHDFGFSKNGIDTLARWGRERLLSRLAGAYRRERPDIVIPTFLDVPGQHGHHRAMTEAAEAAIALAADPNAFPEHFAEGLSPWRVAKYYLPAWSGGGGTYDDEVPPPNATTTVAAPGPDPATGATYAEIGEWSRAYHASQGMGRFPPKPQQSWGLHLKLGPAGEETGIAANLPATLAEVADQLSEAAATELRAAHAAIEGAIAAFPDRGAITEALTQATPHLEAARSRLTTQEEQAHGHRLARKAAEIDAALLLAVGIDAAAWLEPAAVSPGGSATLRRYLRANDSANARMALRLAPGITAGEPVERDGLVGIPLAISPEAQPTNPFGQGWASLGGNGEVGALLTATIAGRSISVPIDLDEPLQIVPAQSVTLDPEALVVPLSGLPSTAEVAASMTGRATSVTLDSARGISIEPRAAGFRVVLDSALPPGRHRLTAHVDGAPASRVQPVSYPHIGDAALIVPATLDVLALDLRLPANARIGYVGAGSDRVGLWLRRMGLDVVEIDAEALAGDLSSLTTIVVGIFAFGQRPDLAASTDRLHRWVEAGGHLVTLYHRPSDGWDPDNTPPRHLVIGSPSLRWRVTDPAAAVEVLAPDHPLLTSPNRIGPADWAGWDKERGLYFASEWDPVYEPLLAMHDAGEAPLRGALLSGRIGTGRHTHTSLVLHHQLDRLVPGAFRLMANLVQPAR